MKKVLKTDAPQGKVKTKAITHINRTKLIFFILKEDTSGKHLTTQDVLKIAATNNGVEMSANYVSMQLSRLSGAQTMYPMNNMLTRKVVGTYRGRPIYGYKFNERGTVRLSNADTISMHVDTNITAGKVKFVNALTKPKKAATKARTHETARTTASR